MAGCIAPLLKQKLQIELDEHETGYIALHVHSAIVDEKVSQAMEIAGLSGNVFLLLRKKQAIPSM